MPGARPLAGGFRSPDEIVALGRRLLEGKGEIAYSERARQIGVAAASAGDYMRIAKTLGDCIGARPLAIDYGALIELSGAGVSPQVRAAVIERAGRGERITRKVAQAAIDRQRSGK